MSDELENGLNKIREGIREKRQKIINAKKTWEGEKDSEDDLVRVTSKSFLFTFQVLYDIYRNLESMYISNEAWSKQIDLLKDTIFQLDEVKRNPQFQNQINEYLNHIKNRLMNWVNHSFKTVTLSWIQCYDSIYKLPN